MSEECIEHTCHYSKKWVSKINADAITFGRHIFYTESKMLVSDRLHRHELAHVRQYEKYRIFGIGWISIPLFLIVYVGQWIGAGFRYSKIPYEIEARIAENININ